MVYELKTKYYNITKETVMPRDKKPSDNKPPDKRPPCSVWPIFHHILSQLFKITKNHQNN